MGKDEGHQSPLQTHESPQAFQMLSGAPWNFAEV